mgnify:CR=1 FL=1
MLADEVSVSVAYAGGRGVRVGGRKAHAGEQVDEVFVSVGEKPPLADPGGVLVVPLSVCEWRVQLDGTSSGQKKSGIHGGTMAIAVHTRRMVDASRRGLRDGNAGRVSVDG